MKCQKLVGAGNDFIFFDLEKIKPSNLSKAQRKKWAIQICDRHFGVGADGAVFVEVSGQGKAKKYRWDFYNSDGSSAEMCGNAARCMGRWLQINKGISRGKFASAVGEIETSCGEKSVKISYELASLEQILIHSRANGEDQTATLVNSGVPHAVVKVPSGIWAESALQSWIVRFRHHAEMGPEGANVTFIRELSALPGKQKFQSITFERGVEDFTLACGTGVIATAMVGLGGRAGLVTVEVPGGHLKVRLPQKGRRVELTGPADLVADIEWKS